MRYQSAYYRQRSDVIVKNIDGQILDSAAQANAAYLKSDPKSYRVLTKSELNGERKTNIDCDFYSVCLYNHAIQTVTLLQWS